MGSGSQFLTAKLFAVSWKTCKFAADNKYFHEYRFITFGKQHVTTTDSHIPPDAHCAVLMHGLV
jgi:hypothetical protein